MERIDPNIALGFKQPQIQDPVAATMRAQEIGVNALKMGELQRGVETQNKLRQLFSEGVDVSTPEGFKSLAAVDPAAAMKLRNDALQGRKLQAETGAAEFKLTTGKIDQAIKDIANYPTAQDAFKDIQRRAQAGDLPKDKAEFLISQLNSMPYEKFQIMQLKNLLGAKDRITTDEQARSNKVKEGIQQSQLDLSREGQRLQYDPELQGRIAGAKTTAQEAAKRETAGNIDVISNRKALAQAGYDVATGKDDITDLIKKSTGSYLGKAVDISGRAVGKSTEGSKAIAALEQKAGAITFGLLNGKLGAGISNADVQLIVSLVGKVSDGTLPVEDRLAAWDSTKTMMKKLGMVDEPTGDAKPNVKPTAPTNKTPTLPSGFKLD
jgi:hypothetical protein